MKNKFKKYALGGGDDPKPKAKPKPKTFDPYPSRIEINNLDDIESIRAKLSLSAPKKLRESNYYTETPARAEEYGQWLDEEAEKRYRTAQQALSEQDWLNSIMRSKEYRNRYKNNEGASKQQYKKRLSKLNNPFYIDSTYEGEIAGLHNPETGAVALNPNYKELSLGTYAHEKEHHILESTKDMSPIAKQIYSNIANTKKIEEAKKKNPSLHIPEIKLNEAPAYNRQLQYFLDTKTNLWKYGQPMTNEILNSVLEDHALPKALRNYIKYSNRDQIIKANNILAQTNTKTNKYSTMAKLGIKLKPKFQQGGRVYDLSGTKSKIADGVLHREKNNIPQQADLGKKGIPVVVKEQRGGELEKHAEVEVDELIIPKVKADKLEQLVYKYIQSNNPSLALQIGKFMQSEILHNTIDSEQQLIAKA